MRVRRRSVKIGIVGFGTVGRALARFFERGGRHRVAVYDRYLDEHASPGCLDAVEAAEVAFVAVPTPFDPRTGACDLAAVREVVARFSVPLCIKSTIPPGTTEALARESGKPLAFSPEYLGESPGHPWREIDACGFVIVAGDPAVRALVRDAYALSAPNLVVREAEPRAAELAKYMENCFLATKVAFVNQFADLAERAGVDFEAVRSLFLLDERVGASHTEVSAERGFGGRCLPKDLQSILAWAGGSDNAPLLECVLAYNEGVRRRRYAARLATNARSA